MPAFRLCRQPNQGFCNATVAESVGNCYRIRNTRGCACAKFASSRIRVSSCAWAPRLSLRAAAAVMVANGVSQSGWSARAFFHQITSSDQPMYRSRADSAIWPRLHPSWRLPSFSVLLSVRKNAGSAAWFSASRGAARLWWVWLWHSEKGCQRRSTRP